MTFNQRWEKSPFPKVKSSVNSLSFGVSIHLDAKSLSVESRVYCWYFFEVEVKFQFIHTEFYVKSNENGTQKDNL